MVNFNKYYLALALVIGIQSMPVNANTSYPEIAIQSLYSTIMNNKIATAVLVFISFYLAVDYQLRQITKKIKEEIRTRLNLQELTTYAQKKKLFNNPVSSNNDDSDCFNFDKKFDFTTSTMALSYTEGVQENIGKILKEITTKGGIETLLLVEKMAYQELIKENEDSLEDNCRLRQLRLYNSEKPLSELRSGVSGFQNIINSGLIISSNLLKDNNIEEQVSSGKDNNIEEQVSSGGEMSTQIDHFFDPGIQCNCPPPTPFLYHMQSVNKEKQHHLYLSNAKLYAQLTHYYADSIGAIAKIFENTQKKLQQNPCPTICIH